MFKKMGNKMKWRENKVEKDEEDENEEEVEEEGGEQAEVGEWEGEWMQQYKEWFECWNDGDIYSVAINVTIIHTPALQSSFNLSSSRH